MQNGPMGDKKFEDESGARVQHLPRARLYSGSIHVGGARGESHSVTSGDIAGGQLQE